MCASTTSSTAEFPWASTEVTNADGRQCRAVFLDENTSQPICRLYVFDEDEPDQIALFDKSPITLGKTPEEDRQDIASVDDIHNFAERIRLHG